MFFCGLMCWFVFEAVILFGLFWVSFFGCLGGCFGFIVSGVFWGRFGVCGLWLFLSGIFFLFFSGLFFLVC